MLFLVFFYSGCTIGCTERKQKIYFVFHGVLSSIA